MTEYHPKADKERRRYIDRQVEGIESDLLRDIITDATHYGDTGLLRLCSAKEWAYTLAEDDQTVYEDAKSPAFRAGTELKDAVEKQAEEEVWAVIEQVANDEIPLDDYPEEPGAAAMDEAIEIIENGALPEADHNE